MSMEARATWEAVCRDLSALLSPDVYERWIAHIQAGTLTDDTLTLIVANDFYQTWLEEHYLSLIHETLAKTTGRPLRIQFAVSDQPPPPVLTRKAPPPRKRARTAPVLAEPPQLNPRYTFDQFIVGPSNSFAHAAALAVTQALARAYNPLFIYGSSGLGKTHLMHAIGASVARDPHMQICYRTCEAFTNEYIHAIQTRELIAFRKRYRSVDLLLIDDVHFLADKNGMQEEFFHTFNALFENQKQIVLTSDRPAGEIPKLENRLVTRFDWGLASELERPDLETRIAILRAKRTEQRLQVPDAVLTYLAERIRANIRRLEGALVRVAAFAALNGQADLPRERLDRLLRDMMDQEETPRLGIECIQRAVAEHFDIRLADLNGNRRPKNIAWPRQVAMYLSRELTQESFPAIGAAFGRNHATVLHACRQVTATLGRDESMRRRVNQLAYQLQGRP
ncbi:MAG: chromosomal replication initiator protein DnaA [Candidatus Marinimicrobia bacterium]|nr:chromosomal replication initiator protein DnaA [Candidatus Neomarinimicrobiota bacterium]